LLEQLLEQQAFDEIVLATGVMPRTPEIDGIDHPKVLGYADVLARGADVGERVAVIGAGGIGVDVSEFLTHATSPTLELAEWMAEGGVGDPAAARGGLVEALAAPSPRQVYLLQRTPGRIGARLGRTSGWVHRASLARKQVTQLAGVRYERIDDDGVHIEVHGERRTLAVDSVIVCAGQEPRRDLRDALERGGASVHLVGGADRAVELDAKRAIDQATRLALVL
jgi:2,4-dienoyl-CoA reductase (NADPH2)